VYLTRHYVLPALPATFWIEGVPRAAALLALGAATAFAFWLSRRARWRNPAVHRALLMAVPAAVAVYVVRRAVLPALPEDGFRFGTVAVPRDLALMLLLAAVMLVTGLAMLHGAGRRDPTAE